MGTVHLERMSQELKLDTFARYMSFRARRRA